MQTQPFVTQSAPGVRYCALETDRFKTGQVDISLALPLEGELSAGAALPFFLHRSCNRYRDFTLLNGRLAELYGASLTANVKKTGEAQVLSLGITFVDDRFALAGEQITRECAGLLLDMIFDPYLPGGLFDAAAVESEKRILMERYKSELDDKRRYALLRCSRLMCADEKYGSNPLGSEEGIRAISPLSLRSAWEKMLSTAVAQITVVGSGACGGLAQNLAEKFSFAGRQPVLPETLFIERAGQTRRFTERQPVSQGKLVLGLRAAMRNEEDNAPAIRVMTDIFGGSTHSKLFTVVREKMSLCYYCFAGLIADKGILFVQSGIDSEKSALAEEAILNQLDEMKNGKITQKEYDASLLSLSDRYASVEDSSAAALQWYAAQVLRNEIKTPAGEREKISRVTKAQAVEAARAVTLDTVYMLESEKEGVHEGQ